MASEILEPLPSMVVYPIDLLPPIKMLSTKLALYYWSSNTPTYENVAGLYVFHRLNQVMYVGKSTDNVRGRIRWQMNNTFLGDIDETWCIDVLILDCPLAETLVFERILIKAFMPSFNIYHRKQTKAEQKEPDIKTYEDFYGATIQQGSKARRPYWRFRFNDKSKWSEWYAQKAACERDILLYLRGEVYISKSASKSKGLKAAQARYKAIEDIS